MKITQTKRGFNLNDCGLKIRFTSYEFTTAHVYLYCNNVLRAIYENREKFEKALAVAKGNDYQS
jgi:hypothetical protein